jgi:ABC-2 type transporter
MSVQGLDVLKRPDQVRQVIGVVAQKSGSDPMATGRENLILQGHLFGMRGAAVRARADELLDRLTFLSSAFLPTALMPGWMRAIAACNPLNWAVQAGRHALNANAGWSAVAVRGAGLLALAVVCVTVSVATFRAYQKSV